MTKMEKSNNNGTLKNTSFFLVMMLFLLLSARTASAADIELGLHWGYRQLKDANLKDIYGSGFVFRPQVRYGVDRNIALELAYEGGYKKDGPVGLYDESSSLTMNAWEAAAVLRMEHRGLIPFIKGGLGYYGYKQDIDSAFVRKKVDHHSVAPFAGAGLDVALFSGLHISGAVHYVFLKVKPFDVRVDLGGLRVLLGLRYRLPF